MSNTQSNFAKENAESTVWEYVPVSDFTPPSVAVAELAKKGLSQLWQVLRSDNEVETTTSLDQTADLRGLQAWQKERLTPQLDWNEASQSLRHRLKTWLQSERPDQPVVLLVQPPHAGHAEILRAWIAQSNENQIRPPSREQIMLDQDAWLTTLPAKGAFWVYPSLEKTYLRHENGLSLIRAFLDRAFSGALGRGIIGCDSWAWAFLQHVWRGTQPITITSKPFDESRLTLQFQSQANSRREQPLHFRQADNGAHVLPPKGKPPENVELSDYVQHLAAFARGNPGVARAIWAEWLRVEPDETMAENVDSAEQKLTRDTIWVTAWDHVEQPTFPASGDENAAFILHTLLLHNGLTFDMLQRLLPLARNVVVERLFQLDDAGLVTQEDESWKVSARGYPAVREFLQANRYLVDQF